MSVWVGAWSDAKLEGFLSVCRKANILVSFLVDVALGVLLMSWLYRDNHISMLANTLVPAADVSLARLPQVVSLPPEGPKRNSPSEEFTFSSTLGFPDQGCSVTVIADLENEAS